MGGKKGKGRGKKTPDFTLAGRKLKGENGEDINLAEFVKRRIDSNKQQNEEYLKSTNTKEAKLGVEAIQQWEKVLELAKNENVKLIEEAREETIKKVVSLFYLSNLWKQKISNEEFSLVAWQKFLDDNLEISANHFDQLSLITADASMKAVISVTSHDQGLQNLIGNTSRFINRSNDLVDEKLKITYAKLSELVESMYADGSSFLTLSGPSLPIQKLSPFYYVIEEELEEFCQGKAVLSNNSSSQPIGISLFLFKKPYQACFDVWKTLKHENIARVFYCDDDVGEVRVVIEKIYETIEMWVVRKMKGFEQKGPSDGEGIRKANWWKFIQLEFCQIFRDIIRGLWYLFDNDLYHGCLEKGIVLTKDGRAKLLLNSSNDKQFEKGLLLDLQSLKSLIQHIISKPFGFSKVESDMEFDLPQDIRNLLFIVDSNMMKHINVKFAMDSPSFWTREERVNFIEKFHQLSSMGKLRKKEIYKWMVSTNMLGNWSSDIQEGTVLYEILIKPREAKSLNINDTTPQIQLEEADIECKESENKSEGPDDEFEELDNVPLQESGLQVIEYGDDIMRFCLNSLHHYNNVLWKRGSYEQKLEKEDIEEKISQLWPNLYDHVREALIAKTNSSKCNIVRNNWLWIQERLLSTKNL